MKEGEDHSLILDDLIRNTVDIFKDTKLVYKTLVVACTKHSCPRTTAGQGIEYVLSPELITSYNIDVVKICKRAKAPSCRSTKVESDFSELATQLPKSITRCPASVYIDAVFSWVQQYCDGLELFSQHFLFNQQHSCKKDQFKIFMYNVKKVYKRLFRVYAHIYHHHFAEVSSFGAVPHLNSTFKRFVFFALSHNFLDLQEIFPLESLIIALKRKEKNKFWEPQ